LARRVDAEAAAQNRNTNQYIQRTLERATVINVIGERSPMIDDFALRKFQELFPVSNFVVDPPRRPRRR
jgi:hypothetical protein